MIRRSFLKAAALLTLSPVILRARALPVKSWWNKLIGCSSTTADILGPFYLAGSPNTTLLAGASIQGTRLFINGTVFQNDCITPQPGAQIEVWGADDAGAYSSALTMQLRGLFYSDAAGQYAFETILPGWYLNGAQYRPRHLHFKVSYGSITLVTQLYFSGDPYISIDPWASQPSAVNRIIPLTTQINGSEAGTFDINLAVISSIENNPFNQEGFLVQNTPNPFNELTHINFGVFETRDVILNIYDVSGKMVKQLVKERMSNGRYLKGWDGRDDSGRIVAGGIYICSLYFDNELKKSIRMLKTAG